MSPMHAKALAEILGNAVEKWERQYGPLPAIEALLPDFVANLNRPSADTGPASAAPGDGGSDD